MFLNFRTCENTGEAFHSLLNATTGHRELDDDEVRMIVEHLHKFERLQRLSLSCNHVSDGGAFALAEALKSNTCLRAIELASNKISDVGAQAFAESLKINSCLSRLNLACNEYTYGKMISDAAKQHVEDLCTVNGCIQSQFSQLTSCPQQLDLSLLVTPVWMKLFVDKFIAKRFDCSNLATISLKHCKMPPDDICYILSLLSGAHNLALSALILSKIGLVHAEMPVLGEKLCKFTSLKQLDVSDNPELGCNGASYILLSLVGAHSLASLVLSKIGLVLSEMPALVEQLRKFPALKQLDVSDNPGVDRSAVSLIVQGLSGAQEFVELNLSSTGVESLPDNIGRCLPKLQKLLLDNCKALSCLPVLLGSLNDLQHISVTGCAALMHPPKSQQLDPTKTAKFMRDLHNDSEIWRRLKVVFLGNGCSGKTSLLRTLAKKPLQLDQQSTRGVTVDAFADDLKPNLGDKLRHGFDLELSFWDFAGQLEYSSAHEFFMSTRQAVYVAVYSVLDENESIMQQLVHWLSVIPELTSSPHVRIMVVGTKIDLLPISERQAVLEAKRSVVHQVIEAKGLIHKIHESDILFVSALQSFDAPDLKLSWATCRRALKDRIYENSVNIFACEDLQQLQSLRFPNQCKKMKNLVEKLLKELKKKQTLPCCRLDTDDAVEILGSILVDKYQRRNFFQVDLSLWPFKF